MGTKKFLVCPNCGNAKLFKVFTSSFQVVMQSPDDGICIGESGILPNLRQNDNYVECQLCHERSEYDTAVDLGKRHLKAIKDLKTTSVPAQ